MILRVLPVIFILFVLEFFVKAPSFLLPLPSVIFKTIIKDFDLLFKALGVTLGFYTISLVLTICFAWVFAVLFHRFKWLNITFSPFLTVFQVTPLVAIAPLLLLYFEPHSAIIVASLTIAMFPLLSTLLNSLNEPQKELSDLFAVLKATKSQQLIYLKLPLAFESFKGALPLTSNLALIGVIVGEFVAGTSGGIASLLFESQYRLNTPRLFACLFIIALAGLCLQSLAKHVNKPL